MSKKRPNTKAVKQELFLKCGKIDMYNMEKYSKCKLQLHHEPPFRMTHHTIYEESYLLSADTHQKLHYLEQHDLEEYYKRMDIIKENKKILEKTKGTNTL